MNVRTLLLAPVMVVLVACQSPATQTTTPLPTPASTPASSPASGVDAVVADLGAGGLAAKRGDPFATEPIGGEGTSVCIGAETLQVYTFIDHEAALAASARIDRTDPSKVGNSIVDWTGQPRFWLRDSVIVLYLGSTAATDTALRGLLGQPFAESREPGRGFLPTPPCQ